MDIVAEIENIVSAMKSPVGDITKPPFYFYGHPVQINRELLAEDKNNPAGDTKYPAIFLRLDTTEVFEDGLWKFNLNLAIVDFTDKQYRTEDRLNLVIRPVLVPLYEKFLSLLPSFGFEWKGDLRIPPHEKILRPYLGTPAKDRNTENSFSDPLDGIEIRNLKINKHETC